MYSIDEYRVIVVPIWKWDEMSTTVFCVDTCGPLFENAWKEVYRNSSKFVDANEIKLRTLDTNFFYSICAKKTCNRNTCNHLITMITKFLLGNPTGKNPSFFCIKSNENTDLLQWKLQSLKPKLHCNTHLLLLFLL